MIFAKSPDYKSRGQETNGRIGQNRQKRRATDGAREKLKKLSLVKGDLALFNTSIMKKKKKVSLVGGVG